MHATLTLQPLEWQDIALIPSIQPKDWGDVASRFREHFGQAYFYPIKAMKGSEMLGVGQIILFETSAWLGNIIVNENYWNQGIGRAITLELMQMAKAFGRTNLFLLATPQGQFLYEKLGFQVCGTHCFYRKETESTTIVNINPAIRQATPNHFDDILQLDAAAFGENRSALLKRYLSKAWIVQSDQQTSMEGFYLPELGEGLIVALTPEAGLALLNFRNQNLLVFPIENTALTEYVAAQDYQYVRNAALMCIGNEKQWHPEFIYSRIGGYAG